MIDSKLNFEAKWEAVCKKGASAFGLFEETVKQNHDDIILWWFCGIDLIFSFGVMIWKPISKEQKLYESNKW